MQLNEFASSEALNTEFASKVANLLAQGIATNGEASLVVSGGRTPLPFFKQLAQTDIEWSKVKVTLADERWVDENNDASNTALVKQNLLQGNAAAATFVELKTAAASAFDAEAEVAKNLQALPFPLDVLILGMGEDGHTASLFPCCEQLEQGLTSLSTTIATQPTTAPHERMSLTLNALLNSRQIFIHLVGDSKKAVLDKALAGDDVKEMPIRAVLQQELTPVEVVWAAK
ncbi:6-phosphogluconolactonase [Gayadomonas joobiniege]|uniref:6-phosphogluconolactonase n=1 Tax=Gayadomonas joobiniege TaxID=1234606 RepID=UPI00036717E5|nr:6-phosphogluconolactonase [Gayadomonas joobiniege]